MKAVHKPKVALTPIDYYLKEGLLALVPYYTSGYKSVVITMKSSYPDKRAVSWLLQTIATYYLQDISLIRKHYGKMLRLRNSFSLAFTQHLILMPVKLRKAAEPGENTIGYVSVKAIKRIDDPTRKSKDPAPWLSVIIFKNGRQLPTLNMASTLGIRLHFSREVLAEYQKLFGIDTDKRPISREAFLEQLPNCNCVLLDMFLKTVGLEKNAAYNGAENSLPAPPPRLAPEIFLRKPGINEQRIKE